MLAKSKIYLAKSDTAKYLDLKTYNRYAPDRGCRRGRQDSHTPNLVEGCQAR